MRIANIRPLLFTLGGALLGLGYYFLADCATGSCPLTATPVNAMAYMGFLGWLVSGILRKECDDGCST